jgi:hypothetical protein
MDIGQFKHGFPLPPLKRERNIIYFPGAWREEPAPHPELAAETSWELCREIAEEPGLGVAKYIAFRVLAAIRYANVKSTEKLARYPLEKLDRQRCVGNKAAGAIREAPGNRGYDILADPAGSAR